MDFARFKTDLRTLAGVDVDDTVAGQIVNDRYRMMVGRAKWQMQEVDLGATVAGQERYPIGDDIVDLEELLVGGEPYLRVGTRQLYRLKTGRLRLSWDVSGAFAPAFDSDGVESVGLFEVPETAGDALLGFAAVLPTPLSGTQLPVVPEDIHPFLRDGCVADGLRLVDERLGEADNLDARFEQGIILLQQRKNSRVGSGPVQIQVRGVHW